MESRLGVHPRDDAGAIELRRQERSDARADHLERKLIDLPQRARECAREIGHRWTRIGFDEIRVVARTCVELPQPKHALVLVPKGTQVGDGQRC